MKNIRMCSILMLLMTSVFVLPLMADEDDRRMISRTFEVSEFNAIEVNFPCDINYVPATFSSQLKIAARNSDVFSQISVEVKDGVLILKPEKASVLRNLRSIEVYASSKKLNSVKVNGAADFEASRGINADEAFYLQVNGSCDVDIDALRVSKLTIMVNGAADAELSGLVCDDIDVQINGAGDCDLEGRTKTIDVKVNGAGHVDISDLRADKVSSSIRGAGSVR